MTLNQNRPNTGIHDAILHEVVILCCGEDTNDLFEALRIVDTGRFLQYHEYRCFRFWSFPSFTLVWSGMGSGCLEPLLYEILSSGVIRRLVLIGTAGAMSNHITLGDAYFIDRAYLAAAGVQTNDVTQPVGPRFDEQLARTHLASIDILSTDYYYGFSKGADPRVAALQAADPNLNHSLQQLWGAAPLIDMETAQFYQLCSLLGSPTLQYAAVKGPANHLSQPSAETVNVLRKAVVGAFALLALQLPARRDIPEPAPRKAESAGAEAKLMEEIKLYWTIQLAVGATLGYLGSNLNFSGEGSEKNIYLAGVSFLVIAIGAIYNVIGNYYSRLEGLRAGLADSQENLFTPTIGIAYLLVSTMLGGVVIRSLNDMNVPNPNAFNDTVKGMIVGFLINWIICRRVFREIYDNGPESYRTYSAHLRRLYLYY